MHVSLARHVHKAPSVIHPWPFPTCVPAASQRGRPNGPAAHLHQTSQGGLRTAANARTAQMYVHATSVPSRSSTAVRKKEMACARRLSPEPHPSFPLFAPWPSLIQQTAGDGKSSLQHRSPCCSGNAIEIKSCALMSPSGPVESPSPPCEEPHIETDEPLIFRPGADEGQNTRSETLCCLILQTTMLPRWRSPNDLRSEGPMCRKRHVGNWRRKTQSEKPSTCMSHRRMWYRIGAAGRYILRQLPWRA